MKLKNLVLAQTFFLLCLISPFALSAQTTVFYVTAHPDDWVLFMGDNAFRDAQNKNVHFVLIILSAGDGGYNVGSLPNNSSTPFYLGREEGAMRSIRLATNTDANLTYGSGSNVSTDYVYPASHKMMRRTYNGASVYFFRLPDGGDASGVGYPADHNQTLKALQVGSANGGVDSISSIDGAISFASWNDLVNTLRELVRIEAGSSSTIVANYQDPTQGGSQCLDGKVSNAVPVCDDHMDHLMAGLAFQQAISNSPCIYQALYLDYKTQGLAENLGAHDVLYKAALWGATVSGLTDTGQLNDWNDTYNQFMYRTYSSTVQGSPTCAL